MNLLNVGSGAHYAQGWVNVDQSDRHRHDVSASVFDLPFPDGHFDRVYAGHFFEHIEWEKIPEAVAEIRRVTKPGGQMVVVGPCIQKCIETAQPYWLLQTVIANPYPDHPGSGHEWTPTEKMTLVAMQSAGLSASVMDIADAVFPTWPNKVTDPWQCAISCWFCANIPLTNRSR